MALENEQKAILDWKNGNSQAFEALVRHYMTDAFLVACGFVGNREDARDLSQDAFVKAYRARDRFEEGRPFYPWFYRILKNHCLNFLARSGRRTEPLYYDDSPDRERFPSCGNTPLEELEQSERHRLLHAAIARLSSDHREIIMLKNFKDYSYQQISETLDIPIGTVMSRLYYARRSLKDLIEQLEMHGLPEMGSGLAALGETAGEVI